MSTFHNLKQPNSLTYRDNRLPNSHWSNLSLKLETEKVSAHFKDTERQKHCLTSMSSCVKFSGSSPIMLARCLFPMLNSSTCFWMNSIVNFSGPAAARFFLWRAELIHICLLRTWGGHQLLKDMLCQSIHDYSQTSTTVSNCCKKTAELSLRR